MTPAMDDVTVEFSRSLLMLDWAGVHQSAFPAVWLRDNCPKDRDQRTGQRLVDTADLLLNPQIESIELRSGALRVRWAGEDRESAYPLAWLLANCLCDEHLSELRPKLVTWTGAQSAELCWMDYSDVCADRSAFLKWLRSIAQQGLAFLGGVPATEGEVLQIASLLGYITETNYGRIFDVRAVSVPNNRAYTAMALGLHTDNPYRDPVPGYQILHCLQPSPDGGESIFVDGFAVAEQLRTVDPETYQTLTTTPVAFAFRDRVTDLKTERPLIQLGHRGELKAVHYNNRSTAPLRMSPEEVPAFYRAYRRFSQLLRDPKFEFRVKLLEGNLVVFDNHRILHGRTAFAGTRHLQGCYVNRDGLLSNLAILEETLAG